jgi:cell volume regulation protein A
VALLIFLVRIPIVRFGVEKSTPRADACRMAAMTPKGLAAAVFASLPLEQGVPRRRPDPEQHLPVVLFSILFTSLLIFLQDKTFVGGLYRRIFSGFAPDPTPAKRSQSHAASEREAPSTVLQVEADESRSGL